MRTRHLFYISKRKNLEMTTTLIVGLGNHGMKAMRHSVGHVVINELASALGLSWRVAGKCRGYICEIENDKNHFVLLKPRLLMNLNGNSVAKTAQLFQVIPENVFLIHDELDHPLGKVSVKKGGSANGHNGVKSVMSSLQSDVMNRLRVGIGRPAGRRDASSYVLDDFDATEVPLLLSTVDSCIEVLVKQYNLVEQLDRELKDDRTKG